MQRHTPPSSKLEERLQQLESRLMEAEIQLSAVHFQLHQITTSRMWRSLEALRKLRYWLLYAPLGRRLEAMKMVGQALHPRKLAQKGTKVAAQTVHQLRRLVPALLRNSGAESEQDFASYDVLCLPVMPWNSRVQRPQQLMRQYLAHDQRVFYATLDFAHGTTAAAEPLEKNLFELKLPGTPGTNVYQQVLSDADVMRMVDAIDRLRISRRITTAVVVLQLPFWTKLAEALRSRFGWPVVYDCMDDHSGFSTNSEAMLQAEQRAVTESDLVVVTSDLLYEKMSPQARRTILVRNACDYDHFAQEMAVATANEPRPTTIGFYGAIAEWFDADLVADLAELRPDWKFELIGSTHTGDTSRLAKLPNVTLLGEQPYVDLPRLVAHWDCHLIPFKRLPLTEATNPVKAYEMLATGKPVVAVSLPELRPMAEQNVLALADTAEQFAATIEQALASNDSMQRQRRQAFAAANTWKTRWDDLNGAIEELFPLTSILIATYNNLELNKACLDSIFRRTDYPRYEIIVVDNGSTDGTADWLAEIAKDEPKLRVILNRENRGYAGANNQALEQARGEYLCLLNNDTVVTHGWLSTLIRHLQKIPGLGLAGPVSNSVGNDAKIPVDYRNLASMPGWAAHYCRKHDGQTVPIDMLGFFCAVMPRSVYETVGPLDERFGLGYFEDDDYCFRVRRHGYAIRFARDAFVHHWKEASFNLLGENRYRRLYFENRRKFEAKWREDRSVKKEDAA